ncbi:flagellar hook protein FlgE [Lutibaculum baratangense]|nr:flagellar hook-basal body complex protein [Lutibaculum baratangense]
MNTAVAGLRAQSFALENISGNISNVQTTGYKRMETSFSELVPSSGQANKNPSGSVYANARQTVNVQGDIGRADLATFMAISGDGFFSVRKPTGYVDNGVVLGDKQLFTRRGDFEKDNQGYLVNGGGYYLMGQALDPQTGNPVGNNVTPIRITQDLIPARATTEVTLRANLPATPSTANYDPEVPDSELLPSGIVDTSVVSSGVVAADDSSDFLSHSISGGAITVRDANGQPVNLQMRWAKTANADPSATPPVEATWNLFFLSNSTATGTDPQWTRVDKDYTFDNAGTLTSADTKVTISGLTVNGVNVGDLTLKHGKGGMTQYANSNGVVDMTELKQNGYAAGELLDVAINDSGRVVASYSNGQTFDLYEIPLASFNAPNQLERLDGGAYAATAASGAPLLGANGSIMGSALESSNTDIADEFTKLIVTQQAYSAGTRIVTTSNEMMQEALNMKR